MDLIGLCRHYFPGISKVLLDGIHLCRRSVREAVQPGYIGFCVRFLLVNDVLEDAGKMALGGPDFCGGHNANFCFYSQLYPIEVRYWRRFSASFWDVLCEKEIPSKQCFGTQTSIYSLPPSVPLLKTNFAFCSSVRLS